jgi:hypothetical protein
MDDIYTFVYKGILTQESLKKSYALESENEQIDETKLKKALSFELFDQEILEQSQRMCIIYQAIYTFENMVRKMVVKALDEKYSNDWWNHVNESTQKKVKARKEEESKIKWHTSRGNSEIFYCDFGDLSSIICGNWDLFDDLLRNQEWVKQLLSGLEKSRNVVMHGGYLAQEDVERIGINIRDWLRQTG